MGKGIHFRNMQTKIYTLPETNSEFTPENGWLEYKPFLLGFGLFSGAFAVSFGEGIAGGFTDGWFHVLKPVHQNRENALKRNLSCKNSHNTQNV